MRSVVRSFFRLHVIEMGEHSVGAPSRRGVLQDSKRGRRIDSDGQDDGTQSIATDWRTVSALRSEYMLWINVFVLNLVQLVIRVVFNSNKTPIAKIRVGHLLEIGAGTQYCFYVVFERMALRFHADTLFSVLT